MGVFQKFKDAFKKTRDNVKDKIDDLVTGRESIDESFYEELEEILIEADLGVETAVNAVEELRKRVKEERERGPEEVRGYLKEILVEKLEDEVAPLNFAETPPTVVLVMGVNGVGKTTSIAKLAYILKKEGKRVMLAAGDTFRAAAIEQLEIWSERAGVELIKHQKGSDPAAVVYDAISAARARGIDVVICDTAGRLHTKTNLMEELKKIHRVAGKAAEGAPHEILLVLDATTGQNALNQARLFGEVSKISGIILTKLDGTAKGGIVVAIKEGLDIPIKFIGVGESLEDLHGFNPREFVEALFD